MNSDEAALFEVSVHHDELGACVDATGDLDAVVVLVGPDVGHRVVRKRASALDPAEVGVSLFASRRSGASSFPRRNSSDKGGRSYGGCGSSPTTTSSPSYPAAHSS